MKAVTVYQTVDGKTFDNSLDALLHEFKQALLTTKCNYLSEIKESVTTSEITAVLKWAATTHPKILNSLLEASGGNND